MGGTFLYSMATGLMKAMANLTSCTLSRRTDRKSQERFDRCMSLFGEHALPDLFATGYILWSQFLAADRVEVFDGTECLSVGIGDTVVLCLVLVGKEGKNLSEPDIDSVLRSTDQVLPLVELPSRLQESGTTSYWASFRSDFEDILRQGDDSSSSSQDAIDQPRSTGAPMTFARVHKWDSILCRRHDDTPSTYVEKRRFAISVAVFMAQHPNLWNANERVAIGKAIIRFYLVSTSNDHLSTPSVCDMMKEIFEHVSRDYTENGNGKRPLLALQSQRVAR